MESLFLSATHSDRARGTTGHSERHDGRWGQGRWRAAARSGEAGRPASPSSVDLWRLNARSGFGEEVGEFWGELGELLESSPSAEHASIMRGAGLAGLARVSTAVGVATRCATTGCRSCTRSLIRAQCAHVQHVWAFSHACVWASSVLTSDLISLQPGSAHPLHFRLCRSSRTRSAMSSRDAGVVLGPPCIRRSASSRAVLPSWACTADAKACGPHKRPEHTSSARSRMTFTASGRRRRRASITAVAEINCMLAICVLAMSEEAGEWSTAADEASG